MGFVPEHEDAAVVCVHVLDDTKRLAREQATRRTGEMANVFVWLAYPVLVGLKLPRGPRTINPSLNNGRIFRTTSGNGLMNDAWFGQTVKPPRTGQASHNIPAAWMRIHLPGDRKNMVRNAQGAGRAQGRDPFFKGSATD
jgi:hypothetical protein